MNKTSKTVKEKKNIKFPIKHNEITNDTKKSFKSRVIVGAILTCIVVPCAILGGWFYLILVGAFVACATYEIASAPTKKFDWFCWLVVFLSMFTLIYWNVIRNNISSEPPYFDIKNFDPNISFQGLFLSPYALGVVIIAFFIVIIFKKEFEVSDACYLIAMTVLLAIGFQSILTLRFLPFKQFVKTINGSVSYPTTPMFLYFQSFALLLYVLISVCFNDIGAYIVGVLFGKHKVNPRISPKKTWEGFVGGIVVSTILSSIFALIIAHFNLPMLPKFTINHWYWIILCSLLLPIAGDIGDFAFSAIKRTFNKKDYSKVLGAHGGILDRIDSILFASIVMIFLATFIEQNWSLLG